MCTACHGAGIAGAPKAGDKAAWEPRIKEGKNALYEAALKGKGYPVAVNFDTGAGKPPALLAKSGKPM